MYLRRVCELYQKSNPRIECINCDFNLTSFKRATRDVIGRSEINPAKPLVAFGLGLGNHRTEIQRIPSVSVLSYNAKTRNPNPNPGAWRED